MRKIENFIPLLYNTKINIIPVIINMRKRFSYNVLKTVD